MSTPASLGFQMPPEWAPQSAVWLSWPLSDRIWPGGLTDIQETFAHIAAAISEHETCRINADPAHHDTIRKSLARAKANLASVELYPHPTNDVWCRDHGPIFVKHRDTGELAITDWGFNAWGGKFEPYDLDDAVPGRVAESLGMRRFKAPMIAEGGALEVNGEGLLLTTESVLLTPTRNPQLTKADNERILRDYLGVKDILWLPSGLEGDDTDGHIDTLTRFTAPRTVLTVTEDDPNDPNHAVLRRNFDILEHHRFADGGKLEVVPLPLPGAIRPENWREDRLPATYANFLVINDAVLVPTYRQPHSDDMACEVIKSCFPKRRIVRIDCHDIILEGGALHCLTQQQPL